MWMVGGWVETRRRALSDRPWIDYGWWPLRLAHLVRGVICSTLRASVGRWQQFVTPDGRKHYFNAATNESTWKNPPKATARLVTPGAADGVARIAACTVHSILPRFTACSDWIWAPRASAVASSGSAPGWTRRRRCCTAVELAG